MAKKSKRRAWTTDVSRVEEFANEEKAGADYRPDLKASEGAIRQKAFSIGLSLDFRA